MKRSKTFRALLVLLTLVMLSGCSFSKPKNVYALDGDKIAGGDSEVTAISFETVEKFYNAITKKVFSEDQVAQMKVLVNYPEQTWFPLPTGDDVKLVRFGQKDASRGVFMYNDGSFEYRGAVGEYQGRSFEFNLRLVSKEQATKEVKSYEKEWESDSQEKK